MAFAVTFPDIMLWLHITSVVVGFGGTFAYGIILLTARRAYPRSLPGVIAGISANSRIMVTGGGLVTLITGFYLGSHFDQMGKFYTAFGVVAVVVLLGLSHTIVRRREMAAVKAAEHDIGQAQGDRVEFGRDFQQHWDLLNKLGGAMGLLIIVTVFLMVIRAG